MRGAERHGVKRVVLTSSVAAIMNTKKGERPEILNESVFSDPQTGDGYVRSKTMSEKTAWDFQANLPEGKKFELVTIAPGIIYGPAFLKTDFSSGAVLGMIL